MAMQIRKLIPKIKKKMLQIVEDEKAQAESSTVFFLIVVAIIAIVLIAIVKPMFNRSVKASAKQSALPVQTPVS